MSRARSTSSTVESAKGQQSQTLAKGKRMVPRQKTKGLKRSRGGCDACKKTRVKCTEEKPICNRCLKIGLRCEYNTVPKAWIFHPSSAPSAAASPDLQRPVPASIATASALEYFTESISPNTAYYFGGSTKNFLLWDPVALHFLHTTEPAFQHGLAALSLLSRAFWDPSMHVNPQKAYHQHMAIAYGELCKRAPSLSIEMLLACAIVLVRAELMRKGPNGEAALHLEALLRIMWEWEDTIIGSDDLEKADTLHFFWRMILGTIVSLKSLGWKPAADGRAPRFLDRVGIRTIPEAFLHSAHAACSLQSFMIFWASTTQACQWDWIMPMYWDRTAFLMQQWLTAFQRRKDLHKAHPDADLVMAHCYAITVIAKGGPDMPATQASHTQVCLNIIQRMKKALAHRDRILEESQELLSYTGFLPPLYFVATTSTCAKIQREAICLLRDLGQHEERPWNGRTAGLIAQQLLHIRARSSHGRKAVLEKVHLTQGPTGADTVLVFSIRDGWYPGSCESRSSLTVTGQADVDACAQVDWPIVAPLRSYGYIRTRQMPMPFLHTAEGFRYWNDPDTNPSTGVFRSEAQTSSAIAIDG